MGVVDIAELKERISLRGILMTILSLVVAGLAIATIRYQPTPPDERPVSPAPTSTTAPANAPWLAPGPSGPTTVPPAAEPPPVQAPSPTQPPAPTPTVVPTQTYVPAPPAAPAQPAVTAEPAAPSESPSTTAAPNRNRSSNPTLLPNGGRRFGTVQ